MTRRVATLALAVTWLAAPAAAQEPPAPPAPAAGAALEQAYQKEFAYLVAEKRALESRQRELQDEARRQRQRAEAELDQLQARLLAMERRADGAEDRIREVEDAATAAEERADLLRSTVSQAEEAVGVVVPADAPAHEQLAAVFDGAVRGLERGAAVRTEPGSWFRASGEKVDGTVVYVGEVAAFGAAPGASGALLPIGGGRLMLRSAGGGEAEAEALAAGQRPAELGAMWIESVDKPLSERTERTVRETIEAGGLVAWIIVCLGVLAVLLAALRAVLLWRVGRGLDIAQGVAATLGADGREAARAQVAAPSTAAGRVVAAVLRAPEGADREALQDVAAEALLAEQPSLDRFGTVIFVVAAVAPLLGLLGTVTGMIATFEIITEFGTGDPKMLSGGISEALITTQLGLVVAIPAVLLGNLLKARGTVVGDALEGAALCVINALHGDAVEPERAPVASSSAA